MFFFWCNKVELLPFPGILQDPFSKVVEHLSEKSYMMIWESRILGVIILIYFFLVTELAPVGMTFVGHPRLCLYLVVFVFVLVFV